MFWLPMEVMELEVQTNPPVSELALMHYIDIIEGTVRCVVIVLLISAPTSESIIVNN